jgi:hypothetical protein
MRERRVKGRGGRGVRTLHTSVRGGEERGGKITGKMEEKYSTLLGE